MLEFARRCLDLLAAQFGLARPFGIALPRHPDIRDRPAKHQQRLRHAGDFVLTANRHRNVGVSFRDPAHRAAQ